MRKTVNPLLKQIEDDALVEYSVLSIGYNAANEIHKAKIYAKLKPVAQRKGVSQEQIVQKYRDVFKSVKGLVITVEDLPPFDTGASNAPVQIVVTGDDLEVLEKTTSKLMAFLENTKGAVSIDRDYESGKPEIQINIIRQNAQIAGVSANDIAAMLGSAYSSDIPISFYEEKGRQFDITLRFDDKYRQSIEDIKRLQVRSANGQFVSLEGLVRFEETTSIASINRFDRERKVMVTSGIFGESLNVVMVKIEEEMKELLPEGYNYRFTGDVENMQDTNAAFAGAIILAVILIYLILAALYESLIQPFIIMVSMPLSFTGVMVALYLTGNNFSLFVMIGIILLLGMVGKNAILVVDFANEAVKKGKSVDDALLEAGEKRLRPILMTTFAMIGAMLPLAFGGGAGSESNAPMALAIIGGLVSSTILTLLVVPAIYKFMYPLDRWLRSFYEKGEVK